MTLDLLRAALAVRVSWDFGQPREAVIPHCRFHRMNGLLLAQQADWNLSQFYHVLCTET